MTTVTCPISGVSLIRAPHLLGLHFQEIHPIFRMKSKDLLTAKIVHLFAKPDTTETDKKLLFLAVLHHTDLVEWHAIAKPTISTVEANFLPAMQVAGWLDFARYTLAREIAFPRFCVREDNSDLSNIYPWLESIEEVRVDFMKKDRDRERSARLYQAHERIFKELKDAWIKDRVFTPVIVKWLFDMIEIEDHPRLSVYKGIMLSTRENAYMLNKEDLEELRELINDRFDASHPLFPPITGQLANLEAERKKGFRGFAIIDEAIYDVTTGETIRKPLAEVYTAKMIKEYGSTDEPQRKDFKEYWQFIQAKAKWLLSQQKAPVSKTEEIVKEAENNGEKDDNIV